MAIARSVLPKRYIHNIILVMFSMCENDARYNIFVDKYRWHVFLLSGGIKNNFKKALKNLILYRTVLFWCQVFYTLKNEVSLECDSLVS